MKKSIFATVAIPVLCACLNPVFAESSTIETTAKAAAISDSEIAGLASGYLGYAGTSEPRRSALTAHAQEAALGSDSLANNVHAPMNTNSVALKNAEIIETTAKAAAITDSEIAGLASGYLGYAGTSEPRRSALTAHAQEAALGSDSLANNINAPMNTNIVALESADPSSALF